ncbi:hypothetical protein DS031_18630 [Bacillus taeanensis]|uniref:Uncharacterized protein n=1 Tax=Bacillus taeanensis TaxID=273032 RepID=A0A366XPQ2_9BACI|nr:hypothetical protein DS031_18630 [Bacillus taeanensis]
MKLKIDSYSLKNRKFFNTPIQSFFKPRFLAYFILIKSTASSQTAHCIKAIAVMQSSLKGSMPLKDEEVLFVKRNSMFLLTKTSIKIKNKEEGDLLP